MQAAADAAPSAMISVIGLDSDKVLLSPAAYTQCSSGHCCSILRALPWLLHIAGGLRMHAQGIALILSQGKLSGICELSTWCGALSTPDQLW